MPTKRTIRRINRSAHHDFDEQFWPVNIALLVLCGFVGGLIIAYSDRGPEFPYFTWNSAEWWRNGYVRLASLFLSVGLFIGLAIWLGGQRGRRFQLAAVISIFIHALLGWQLYQTILANPAPAVVAKDTTPSFVEHTYQPDAKAENAPPQDFEKPVEVNPEQQKPKPVERTAQPLTVKQPQPLVEPDKVPPKPTETPKTEIAKVEPAAPKRAPEQSKLSRADAQTPQALTDVKSLPQPVKAAAPQPTLQAQSTLRERTAEMPAVNPNAQAPAPTATPEPLQLAAANPQAQRVPEQTSANRAANLPRANNTPQNVPQSEITEPSPTAKGSAAAPQLTSSAANTSKSASTPNLNQPEIPRDTTASQSPSPVPSPTNAPPRPDSTAVARADGPAAPARQSTNSSSAVATQAENLQAPGSSAAPSEAALAVNAKSAERGSTSAAVNPNSNAAPANDNPLANNAPGATSVAAAARNDNAAGAAPSRTAAPTGLANRPVARSQAQAIAESIKLPSLEGSAAGTPSEQLGGPATTAVTSRNAQTPGQGTTQNLSSSWSDSNPSKQPIAGAAQPAVTTLAKGNAAAPSRESLTRDTGTAAGNTAANTEIALDVPNAAESGSTTAAPLNATASAAANRADSRAAIGNLAAAAGSSNADTSSASQVTGTQATAASTSRGSGSKVELATGRDAPKRDTLGGGTQLAQNDVRAADLPNGGSSAAGSGQPGSGSGQAPLQASATGGTRGERQASLDGSALALASGEQGGGGAAGTPTGTASVANRNDAGTGTIAGSGSGLQIGRTSNAGTGGIASTAADIAPAAGKNGNAGSPEGTEGAPLAATTGGTGRQAAGLPGPIVNGPLGALAGNPSDGSTANSLGSGTLATPLRVQGTGGTEQLVALSGGNLARTRGATIGVGMDTADLPSLPTTGETGAPAAAPTLQPGGLTGPTTAKSRQSVNVQVAITSSDTGGLGDHYSLTVGTVQPLVRQESVVISNTAARFLNRTSSGAPAIDGQVREAAPAFGRRLRSSNLEAEIELGLKFVASAQNGDGSWNLRSFPGASTRDVGERTSPTAATGLSLLAFLGAGYDHYGEEYQTNVARGLAYLVENQRPDGDLYIIATRVPNDPFSLYSHGIATIALCEAYGMTGDEKLREPAQRAINFIEKAQDRRLGGWRYQPGSGADTSVTGWQLMALKSGELAKLKVNPQTYDGVRKWLAAAEAKSPAKNATDAAQYVYDPNALDLATTRHGRLPTPATTSMGLLMRMYLGWDRQNPDLQRGAQFLLENPPQLGLPGQKKRDTYYWYYASQVMYHMQGEAWRDWNQKLRPLLLNSQVKTGVAAGSWDPGGAVPDKWGAHGGRLYVTTMNLLSLEVAHRYLPIYETIAEKK
jgi:hypothetical protein